MRENTLFLVTETVYQGKILSSSTLNTESQSISYLVGTINYRKILVMLFLKMTLILNLVLMQRGYWKMGSQKVLK